MISVANRVIGAGYITLSLACVEQKTAESARVKYWVAIAESLIQAGFNSGCSSKADSSRRVFFTAEAYSRDDRQFIVLADERLTAFSELERATGVALGERAN